MSDDRDPDGHLLLLAEIARTLRDLALKQLVLTARSATEVHRLLITHGYGERETRPRPPARVRLSRLLFAHALSVAEEVKARAVVLHGDAVGSLRFIEDIPSQTPVVLATADRSRWRETPKAVSEVLQVPFPTLSRLDQVDLVLLFGLSRGLFARGDTVVSLSGAPTSGFLDTLLVLDVGREFPAIFDAHAAPTILGDVEPQVLEKVLQLALDLAREGREGRPVGTIFVIGDHERVAAASRQMVINPFRGYLDEEKNVLDPSLGETLKEFSTIDGAFVIRGDGVILSAGHVPQAGARDGEPALGSRRAPRGRCRGHGRLGGARGGGLPVHGHGEPVQGRRPGARPREAGAGRGRRRKAAGGRLMERRVHANPKIQQLLVRALNESMSTDLMVRLARRVVPDYDIRERTGFQRSMPIPSLEVAGQIARDLGAGIPLLRFVETLIEVDGSGVMGSRVKVRRLEPLMREVETLGYAYDEHARLFMETAEAARTRTWSYLQEGQVYELSFLKIDVVASSKLVREHAKAKIDRAYQDLQRIVVNAVYRRNGRVWLWEGDGGVLAFLFGDKNVQAALAGHGDHPRALPVQHVPPHARICAVGAHRRPHRSVPLPRVLRPDPERHAAPARPHRIALHPSRQRHPLPGGLLRPRAQAVPVLRAVPRRRRRPALPLRPPLGRRLMRTLIVTKRPQRRGRRGIEHALPARLAEILPSLGPGDLLYLDLSSFTAVEARARLKQLLGRSDLFVGVIDPKGTVKDVPTLFHDGAVDYVDGAAWKAGIPPRRLGRAAAYARLLKRYPDAAGRATPTARPGRPSGADWSRIREGEEYTFSLLFIELDGAEGLEQRFGAANLAEALASFHAYVERSAAPFGGRTWIWSRFGGIVLFPFDGRREQAAPCGLSMVLYKYLYDIEESRFRTSSRGAWPRTSGGSCGASAPPAPSCPRR